MRVEFDTSTFDNDLKAFEAAFTGALTQCITDCCLKVVDDAKAKCYADTGNLRRSIDYEVRGSGLNQEGIIGTPVEYAIYAHEGTGIYSKSGLGRQEPWTYRNPKAVSGDNPHGFITTVGMFPNPFLEMAADQNQSWIRDRFESMFE